MPATYSGTGSTSTAGIWTAIVTIDGSDVSARVIARNSHRRRGIVSADGRIHHSPGRNPAFAVANWVWEIR